MIGGWVGDRFGPRKTLFWCGLIWAAATIATGFVTSLPDAVHCPRRARFRRRRDLPDGDARHAILDAGRPAAASRKASPTPSRGSAMPRRRRLIAALDGMASPGAARSWRWASSAWCGAWSGRCTSATSRGSIPAITEAELAALPPRSQASGREVPWGPLLRRMWPVTLTYFCYGWTLWLYLNWLPLFFKNTYSLDHQEFGAVRLGRVLRRRHRRQPGRRPVRPHPQADRQCPLGAAERHGRGISPARFCRCFRSCSPATSRWSRCACPAGFFFAEITIGPMWSIPMDIAPKYSGHGLGHDEHRLGAGGDRLAAGGRLCHRCHRQLVPAVPDVDGVAAAGRRSRPS